MNANSDINIATDSLNKGIISNGKELIAWDCIQECDLEVCPIAETCIYQNSNKEKCGIQIAYLNSLTNMIFSSYRYLGQDILFKVGMQLIPLYSQLCRQKIVEKSLKSITYHDNKGVLRIHPIYKEIRETLKVITGITREIGFISYPNPDLPPDKEGFGDPNHYRNISQNTDNKQGIIR